MPEAKPKTDSTRKELETLLADAAAREKLSRKRAVLYTVIPIIVGAAFLGVSLYTTHRLQQGATKLKNDIEVQKGELQKKIDEANQSEGRAKTAEIEATKAQAILEAVRLKLEQRKAEEALNLIPRKPIRETKSSPPQSSMNVSKQGNAYDGSLSLEELRNHIRIEEAIKGARLVSIVAANINGTAVNKVSYVPVDPSWYPGNLILVQMSNGSDLNRAVAAGGKKVLEANIYVEGKITRIAAFRLP